VRIIAGALKGRRLAEPTWPGLRPTSDKLRETLFNVLGPLDGARVIDAYAGSGAIGLEAHSRGAARVTFVELDQRACRLIDANVRRCDAGEACAIIRADFVAAARRRLPDGEADLVFLDPPYETVDVGDALAAAARLLAPDGRIVLEHAWRRPAPEMAGALARRRVIRSGDSALAIYDRRQTGG